MTRNTLIPNMRQWTPQPTSNHVQALGGLIGLLGEPEFESTLLQYLHPVVPAASYSIYQTGIGCAPQLFMSASLGVPDTTRDCWRAYLSGPHLTDRSLVREGGNGTVLLGSGWTVALASSPLPWASNAWA